jgi:hypothetical protein
MTRPQVRRVTTMKEIVRLVAWAIPPITEGAIRPEA